MNPAPPPNQSAPTVRPSGASARAHADLEAPACPICSGTRTRVFFELRAMPVFIGVQWPTVRDAQQCAKGDLRLAFCPGCGMIWNVAFDPALVAYSPCYDNSLHFSGVFQEYSRSLVKRLIADHGLRDKDVIDIGCGKGDFLAMLCEEGMRRGVGYDPSYEGARAVSPAADRLTYHVALFSKEHATQQADLITCRYVLEHIGAPAAFLRMLRIALPDRPGTIVYFEVPNADLFLRELSVWDVIYEHCSYFGIESLTRAFEASGFEVLNAAPCYSGQFVFVEARPRADGQAMGAHGWGDLRVVESAVEAFARAFDETVRTWRARLDRWAAAGRTVTAWGAGAKAVGFFNMLQAGPERVPCVVDINPHKQGRHLAGTGQLIIPPAALKDAAPDVVILMNPIYRGEVERELASLGIRSELIGV